MAPAGGSPATLVVVPLDWPRVVELDAHDAKASPAATASATRRRPPLPLTRPQCTSQSRATHRRTGPRPTLVLSGALEAFVTG